MAKSLNKDRLPIVLFDIDYTLFDVEYFDECFHKELSKIFKEDEELIRSTSIEIIVTLIEQESFLDIDKYLEILLSKLEKKKHRSEVEHFLFETSFFKNGFYTEVEKSLKSLKNIARLGIFSQGDEKLQGAKIKQSGFNDLFEQDLIYIIKPKKLDFLPLLKRKHHADKVYLVEDKPSVIQSVKEFIPSMFTIWVERGKYAKSQKDIAGFSPDAKVRNLRDVVGIVNQDAEINSA